MRRLAHRCIVVVWTLGATQAFAQQSQRYNTPADGQGNQKYAPGVVEMCRNATGLAVPVSSGTCANGQPPYQFTPVGTEQHGLAITSATALTVPTGALFATVCVRGNNVNWRADTAPTALAGNPLSAGQCQFFAGAAMLAALQFIQVAATATLDVNYSK